VVDEVWKSPSKVDEKAGKPKKLRTNAHRGRKPPVKQAQIQPGKQGLTPQIRRRCLFLQPSNGSSSDIISCACSLRQHIQANVIPLLFTIPFLKNILVYKIPRSNKMALIKCHECRHEISESAKTCPNCGAKNKRIRFIGKFFLGLVVCFLLLTILGNLIEFHDNVDKQRQLREEAAHIATLTPEQRRAEEEAKKQNEKLIEEQRRKELGLVWRYDEYTDKMSGKTVKTATLHSLNEIAFNFPYSGLQRATLILRKHPEHGVDAMISVQRGQFLCRIDSCTVTTRFDEEKPRRLKTSEPSDHSTTMLFIDDAVGFLANIRGSKKLLIQAEFYQEGSPAMEFDISGLNF
jgi:cell division protein FtsB